MEKHINKINLVFLGGEDVSARLAIAKRLINLNCNIEIIGSEKKDIFYKNGIKYHKIFLNREFSVFDDIKSVIQIRKIIRKYKNKTIIHSFDTKLAILLPLSALGLSNIKVIRTITGMGRIFSGKEKYLKKLYNFFHYLVKPRVNYTIFQNTDNCNYFIRNKLIYKNQYSIVSGSGIDMKYFSKPVSEKTKLSLRSQYITNKNSPTFILISRLIIQKGVVEFLNAAKMCFSNGYNFNFLLVGPIDINNDKIDIDTINEYKDYVTYLGKRNDIKDLLSVSDVFVLPTFYSEGLPRVLLEAASMGLILLTTNTAGCNDILKNKYNGLFVKKKDSLDIYKKMILVTKDKNKMKVFSKNSKVHSRNFSLDIVVKKYLSIYYEIIL